ncbi:MAG: L-seryl-tRNA(Sec) selenium transferase [Planctomycetales bacterium]|nr:L-seryl-tRNA(Sec) selenium transferase [Planctomycetales bacterium]
MPNVFRNLPSVNDVLDSPPMKRIVERANRSQVVSRVRGFLDTVRHDLQSAASEMRIPTASELAERIADWIAREDHFPMRPVVNATGVLLPAKLGRAPLAAEAAAALAELHGNYVRVADGEEASEAARAALLDRQLRHHTGAEAALVLSNEYTAIIAALAALASGKSTVIARGELIELSDGQRLEDLVRFAGSTVREVGAANRTTLADYQAGWGEQAALVMAVNAISLGESQSRGASSELLHAARESELPILEYHEAGTLADLSPWGLSIGPTVPERIRAGVDLVIFTGDRLLGGPTCGIIVGRRTLVQRIADHPLIRALQADKLTLAALSSTLALYDEAATLDQRLPILSLLATPLDNLRLRAERLAPQLAATGEIASAEAISGSARVFETSQAGQSIPTWCIALQAKHGDASHLLARLRDAVPSILGRVEGDRVLLDLRTVFPRHDVEIVDALERLGGANG